MNEGIAQLVSMVANLKNTVDEKFEGIDNKFARIDERFDMIDNKFARIDERFEEIDKRFDGVDLRLGRIEKTTDSLKINQQKILNSIELINEDIRNNRIHIKRLEEKENYV